MRKNCLVRYATLCSVKIFILHDAARRLFHYALGHLWGGALTSVPDENNVHQFLFKFIFIFKNHIQMEKMTKTVADYSELLVKTFDLPI